MKKLKHELEAQFGVPVFSTWEKVPPCYSTRSSLSDMGVIVPKNAQPDAIKNSYPSKYFFLFNRNKPEYKPPTD